MILRILLPALVLIGTAGCVRRDGRNTNCEWPGEAGAQKLSPSQTDYAQHLSADAEFAEELADRYALKRARPGDKESFVSARKQCLQVMFTEVANVHGVTLTEVSRYLGTKRTVIDITLNLPFVFLYALASRAMGRRIWRRCTPSEGWLLGAVLVLLCSLAFGVIGELLGEQWSMITEAFRIGTGHLGVRFTRLSWVRHPGTVSAFLVVLFWSVAAVEGLSTSAGKVAPRMKVEA